eukprot:s4943_g2.t1
MPRSTALTWADTGASDFPARCDHAMVVLPWGKDKHVLLLGGVARGRWALQDVWCSRDGGATWRCTAPAAPWTARSGHAAVARRSDVLMLGGVGKAGLSGDIWRCSDGQGAEWTCEGTSAEWPARYGHSLLLLETAGHETLLLLAGVTLGRFLNDVWRSDDGLIWRRVAVTGALWAPRAAVAAATVGAAVVVAGGRGEDGCFGDVWISEDTGSTWSSLASSVSAPPPHSGAALVCLDGSLLLMGGFDGEDHNNSVWKGSLHISCANSGVVRWSGCGAAVWQPRYCHRVALLDELVIMTGGHGAQGWGNLS